MLRVAKLIPIELRGERFISQRREVGRSEDGFEVFVQVDAVTILRMAARLQLA